MAARSQSNSDVGPGSWNRIEPARSDSAQIEGQGKGEELVKIEKRVNEAIRVQIIGEETPPMRPILNLSLGLNLLFAQAAVAKDSWFGVDKIKHFFLSAFVTSVSFSAIQAAGANKKTAMTGALGVSLAVGVTREIYNKRTTKLFSVKDLTWDAVGTTAAAVVLNKARK